MRAGLASQANNGRQGENRTVNSRIKTSRLLSHRGVIFVLAIALPATALLAGTEGSPGDTEGQAKPGGLNGDSSKIAYTVGNDIYVMLDDGTKRKRLTRSSSGSSNSPQNQSPTWSPDGQKIAFTRLSYSGEDDDQTSEIYVMSSNGQGLKRLTAEGVQAGGPAWSPDGQKIAYSQRVRSQSPDSSSLYIMNVDGTKKAKLVEGSGFSLPTWSPDGKKIAFSQVTFNEKTGAAKMNIYTVNQDGSGQKLLSRDGWEAVWSPDGKKIAFVSGRDKNGEWCGSDECFPNGEIYVMNSDGTGQKRLTKARANDRDPAWSPDGRQIAFASTHNYPSRLGYEIYAMRADGHCQTRLTNSSVSNTSPSWQSTGRTSAPSTGQCQPRKRIRPTVDVNLKPAKSFKKFPIYYLGKKFGALLLSNAEKDIFLYWDCSKDRSKDCPPGLEIQVESVCNRPSLTLASNAKRHYKTRGALAVYKGYEGGTRVYTGRVVVSIFPGNQAQTKKAIKALRRVNGRNRRDRRLPPPMLPSTVLKKLKETTDAYKKSGSIDAVRKQLKITRSAVRNRLRLARKLRSFGHLRRSNC